MSNLKKVGNLQPMTVTEGVTVNILPYEQYEYLMTTKEVAKGYDTSIDVVRKVLFRHADELIESKHFIKGKDILSTPFTKGVQIQPHQVFWTKRGIVRLGFFIKSERAKLFRDWAEDLIIDKIDEITEQPRNTTKGVARLPYNENEKDVLSWIKDHLIYGDYDKIAQSTGYSVPSVSLVLNRKHVNELIVKEAYRVAIDNKIQGKDDATSVYSPAFISDAMQTIKKLEV